MATKSRGLGRNLNALLGSVTKAAPVENTSEASDNVVVIKEKETETKVKDNDNTLKYLPVDLIQRGKYQPRQEFDNAALEELADSIRAQGLIQPIVVRSIDETRFEIIAGERRWRAAQLAGLHEIPVIIRKLDDFAVVAMALIENIQRENLNPMEEARALHRLLNEFDLTHQQVAEAVGKSRTTVTNILRLMGLHDAVKQMLEHGDLEMGHARALLSLETLSQVQAAKTVIEKSLTVRETEKLIRKLQGGQQTSNTHIPSPPDRIDPNIIDLNNRLADHLAAPVTIQHKRSGKGKLTINYNSLDDLDSILEKILPKTE